MTTADRPLIEAPASDASHVYETLAYLDAYDAVLNCDYAFVAYKETNRGSGEWCVRIRSSQTAGAFFDPTMMRQKAREVDARGEPHFVWGYSFEPSAGDPRHIEFRVHQTGGKPSAIEMLVRLRRADGTPGVLQSVRMPWPAHP